MSNLDVRWVSGLVGPLRVAPGSEVRLPGDFDPGARFGVRKKKDGARLLTQGVELLAEYQQRYKIVSNKLVGGRPFLHVYSEAHLDSGFAPSAPDLEDVFFAKINDWV